MATPNLGFQNFYSTTLSSSITGTDTTIYLNSVPTPTEGYLVIEPDAASNREIIYYTSKGANYVTCPSVAAGRGVGGTSAAAHSSGVAVQMNTVAEMFEALQDGTAFTAGGIGASPYADGWTPLLGVTPNTITANGNRNYDLVFNSVDLTSQLSPGMKLRLTRTVAAPTQCTDLESGSSHYFSKASPSGLSFTTTFTCSAWVKLESYGADMGIIARRNADTEGWSFYVDSTGKVCLQALRIASNNKFIASYASLPLNKWVHVAATMDVSAGDTTAQKVWFDGVEVSRQYTLTGTCAALVQGTTDLVVGALKSAGTSPFDGKLAQVAVFSSQLSDATVKAMINQALTGSETNLVSAYSLNNSIEDLSANNNDLTAQNSAAATNADSPFANAVSAGLQEYCEINSVAFSTNTTVNVRVPDTCQIPTSGGVSAVSYSTQSNPYGLPYFSKVIGEAILGSSFSTTSTSLVRADGLTTTVYVPTGAKVKLSFYAYGLRNSSAGNSVLGQIVDGSVGSGTQYAGFQTTSYSALVAAAVYAQEEIALSPGSHTINVGILVTPGGTGAIVGGAPQALASLRVELV